MQHTLQPRPRLDVQFILGVLALGIIVVILALVVIPRLGEANRPTTDWPTTTPEAQGFDSTKLAEAMVAWREQGIPIHSLLLIRNGYVVADATFYPYDGQTAHDVASVTKSVMTTLIGIAVDQGKLNLDAPMVSFFPDRTIANLDARKEAITVRHLLSMSSGLQCTRDGMENDTVSAMHGSPDFVQFALDLPTATDPGSSFLYCSPAIHLLSPILQQATGMTTLEFARQNLFEPLGITDLAWERDPQGYYQGWGDLSLYPRDMAKIGQLFLQNGQWEGQQIVPREWVEEATAVHMTSSTDDPYGYGWWLSPETEGVYRAAGRLGQNIIVLPSLNTILVTTGGGFEIEEIEELLLAAFADMEKPLPANPAGVARLEAAVAAVAQPPAAKPVAPLPDVARAISGKTYVFDRNAVGLTSLAFEFDDSPEATAHIGWEDASVAAMSIGLDGAYRFSPTATDSRPVGLRGNWQPPQTFILEYNGVVTNDQLALQLLFQDDRVVATASATVGGPGVVFEGRLQAP